MKYLRIFVFFLKQIISSSDFRVCMDKIIREEKSIDAVNKIDITKYKDSMLPLIQKDINELMKVLKTY